MTQHDPMLATQVAIFKRVRDKIAADAALDPEDEAVVDTAEGETDLAGYLIILLRRAEDADSDAGALAGQIKARQERKVRLEARAERLRRTVHNAMTDAGLPKLTAPDFTASRRQGRAPLIITADAAMLPDDMCRLSREPDKVKIRDALKNGAALDYAYLGNAAETLTVRGS